MSDNLFPGECLSKKEKKSFAGGTGCFSIKVIRINVMFYYGFLFK